MRKTEQHGTRIATRDRIHLVVDAQGGSELADVFVETTLAEVGAMFRGRLSASRNPTLYLDATDAERDARARLAALNDDGD